MSSVAAPDIERAFATSHALFAALVFVGPGVVTLVIEPVIFLLADRYPRAWFIRGGLTLLAAASFAAGLAPGPIAMSCALAVAWISIGSASSLAQATLIDRAPDHRARTMARWTLLATLGDLATPCILALGIGWRASYLVVGALLAVWALVTWLTPIDAAPADEEEAEPKPRLWDSLKEALTDRRLIAWLFGLALCDLLDEILVVFSTIHVRDTLGGSALAQSAIVATSMIAGACGLLLLERLLKMRDERRMLIAFGTACAIAFAAWICAPTPWASVVMIAPVGLTATPLYPLVAAQAFAQRPEESGAVLAASHLFTPLGLALPYLIGALADHAGTYVALSALIAQPLGLVALAVALRPRPQSATSAEPARD